MDDTSSKASILAARALVAENDPAEDVRSLKGILFGSIAAIAGSIGWATVLALTERRFSIAASGIGLLVARAVLRGTRKADRWSQLWATALTVASVFFGDALYYCYLISQEFHRPLNLDLLRRVGDHFWEIEISMSGVASLFFALCGAVYVLRRINPQKSSIRG